MTSIRLACVRRKAQGIVNRLLKDAVNSGSKIIVKPIQRAVQGERQVRAKVALVAQQVLQRIVQAEAVQRQRAQL